MKLDKKMLGKAEMPSADKESSSMMSFDGLDLEDEAASEGEPLEGEASENGSGDLSAMSDDELLAELEARGYEVPKPEAGAEDDSFAGIPEEESGEDSESSGPVPVLGPNSKSSSPGKTKPKAPSFVS